MKKKIVIVVFSLFLFFCSLVSESIAGGHIINVPDYVRQYYFDMLAAHQFVVEPEFLYFNVPSSEPDGDAYTEAISGIDCVNTNELPALVLPPGVSVWAYVRSVDYGNSWYHQCVMFFNKDYEVYNFSNPADVFTAGTNIVDSDQDGIPDYYDLAPYEITNPQFQFVSRYEDQNHQITEYLLRTSDGEFFSIGQHADSDQLFLIIGGSEWHDNSELSDFCSNIPALQIPADQFFVTGFSYSDANDYTGGSGGGGSSPETISQGVSQGLQDFITQNPDAFGGTGGGSSGSSPETISQGVSQGLQDFITQNPSAFGGGGGSSSETISQGVRDALNDDTVDVPYNSSVFDAMTTAQSTIKGDASLADDAPDEYKTKTDIALKMADYISNNPLTNIITGSQIKCSGAVSSIHSNLYGHDIDFDLAPYSSQLQVFGQMLLAITTLAGMLLIFRK